jgi:DNA-binding NarL/FixJ family response regulator
MPQPISVATGQFEDLVALGLERLIGDQANLALVARGVPWEGLGPALAEHGPAVLILNFGSLPSLVALRGLLEEHPSTRVVVLANRPSATECNQMLSFGVSACISKETQGRDVINAVHLASRGMHVVPRAVDGASAEFADFAGPELLTAREADVLELLQQGRTNAQISHALSIGLETVRTHARHIYAKLGVGSRRELATLSNVRSVRQ